MPPCHKYGTAVMHGIETGFGFWSLYVCGFGNTVLVHANETAMYYMRPGVYNTRRYVPYNLDVVIQKPLVSFIMDVFTWVRKIQAQFFLEVYTPFPRSGIQAQWL